MHRPSRVAMRLGLQLTASGCALLLLVGPTLTAVHFATVPHGYCAKHDQLVHVARAFAPERSPAEVPTIETAPVSLAREFDHCEAISAINGRVVAPPSRPVAIIAALSDSSCGPARTPQTPHAVALLLLAPKHSPPA